MKGNDDARLQPGLPGLTASLEQAIAFLSAGEDLNKLQEQLDAAVRGENLADVRKSAADLVNRLELISRLTGALEKIDPHTIDPKEFEKLKKKKPTKLVEEALVKGKYRERRMILQARDAETNQNLAWAAWAAAVAAAVTAIIGLIVLLIHK